MSSADMIFPKALVAATRTFADRPEVVGGILVHLVTGPGRKLTDVQQYVAAACEEEFKAVEARRQKWASRKAARRAAGKGAK